MFVMQSPSPDLAHDVALYWEIVNEVRTGVEPYEILPDGNMDLVFRLSPTGFTVLLFGPTTKTSCFELNARDDFFCVRFRPAQARRLVDVPPSSLVDRYLVLDNVFGRSAESVTGQLFSLPDLPSRQLFFDAQLRKSAPLIEDERCRRAAFYLQESNGLCSIQDLAHGMSMHMRSLERLFKVNLGLSPKTLARLIRLQHLMARLRANDFQSYPDLAYACGYAHQSHMIREMKMMTGRLPSTFSFAEPPLRRSAQGR